MHPVASSYFLLFLFFRFSGYLKCPKNSGKIILKISVAEPFGVIKKGRGATTRQPGGLVARPHPGPRRAPSWLPRGSPRRPLRLYLPLGVETPKADLIFANSSLFRRRHRFNIGAAWRSCSGTLPEGDTPSRRPSIAMDASRMCRE